MTPRFMASQYAPTGDGSLNEETGLPQTPEWGIWDDSSLDWVWDGAPLTHSEAVFLAAKLARRFFSLERWDEVIAICEEAAQRSKWVPHPEDLHYGSCTGCGTSVYFPKGIPVKWSYRCGECGLPETLRAACAEFLRVHAVLIENDDEAFDEAFDAITNHADRPTCEDGETNIERAREWSYELLASLGRPYGCGKWGAE